VEEYSVYMASRGLGNNSPIHGCFCVYRLLQTNVGLTVKGEIPVYGSHSMNCPNIVVGKRHGQSAQSDRGQEMKEKPETTHDCAWRLTKRRISSTLMRSEIVQPYPRAYFTRSTTVYDANQRLG
jgi:hypothetical protein